MSGAKGPAQACGLAAESRYPPPGLLGDSVGNLVLRGILVVTQSSTAANRGGCISRRRGSRRWVSILVYTVCLLRISCSQHTHLRSTPGTVRPDSLSFLILRKL